jgi:DNA (cytosine-5)-methyltransferase 1
MNYLDLFSGCGGFRLGLQKAGIIPNNEFHSEIDKHADQIYCNHYLQSENLGDVSKIKTNGTIHGKKIDLVTFGFPCQDLSIAGKGAGLEGNRSGLFFEAMRLVRELKPKIFIFENVKGLLTSNQGKDFETVLREIANIGLYECQWQLCNTRWLLPQNRERIFFIGCLAKSKRSRKQIFPITETNGLCNAGQRKKIQQSDEAWTIKARDYASWRGKHVMEKINTQSSQGQRVYKSNGVSCTLSAQGGGQGAKTGLYAIPVLTPNRLEKRQNGRRFKKNGDPSFTLTTQDRHGVYDGHNIRRLTPIECARLQGFPDDWHHGVSDAQAYKMYGNAVTADIAKLIFQKIYS